MNPSPVASIIEELEAVGVTFIDCEQFFFESELGSVRAFVSVHGAITAVCILHYDRGISAMCTKRYGKKMVPR